MSDDEDTTAAEKANKTIEIKNGLQEELSNTESSNKDDESDNSRKEERFMKSGKGSRSNDVSFFLIDRSYNDTTWMYFFTVVCVKFSESK